MDGVIGQREIVHGRQVPQGQHHIEYQEAGACTRQRFRQCKHTLVAQQWTQHPPRRSQNEHGWHNECQHEMLHHVRREHVIVAEVVQRPVQREKHNG